MDVVMLSRLQFAVTVFFHFIFVPLTLGLVVLLAIMETLYVRTGNEVYKRMVKFWGKLFLINFVLGRRDRDHPRIPVRDQLVSLLGICGRHLRLAAGHRSHGRLLP